MPLPRLLGPVIAFSHFWFARDAGLLISDGNVIELAARPFAVLGALLAANGRAVSAAELRVFVWHGANVDANTVQAQISAIRRALGAERDLIVTVPGRGYRIACDIRIVDSPNLGAAAAQSASSSPSSIPLQTAVRRPAPAHRLAQRTNDAQATQRATPSQAPLAPMSAGGAPLGQATTPSPFIGRHAELSELLAIVPARRIVTLTGAPGIGKTRLATEAAARLAPQFPDGTFCAELASLSQPERVTNAIVAAAGLHTGQHAAAAAAPATLAADVSDRRMLVVVDHCDHLSEAAGQALDTLIANTRGLHIIVTCSSPLFIAGELQLSVAPLRVPAANGDGTTAPFFDDALHLLCAKLAQTLNAAGHDTRLRDMLQSAPVAFRAAAGICRHMGGLPLALELAAASIATRVVAGASVEAAIVTCADALDARLVRRTGGQRVTLPRPIITQTAIELFGATLNVPVRATLRRVAVFASKFSFDAAHEVLGAFDAFGASGATRDATRRDANSRSLQALVAAGFLNAVERGNALHLQMPHAMRRYALAELDRRGESDAAAAHHARYVARALEQTAPAGLRRDIDDVRAALEWSITADKTELSADILEPSAQLWVTLSLLDEYVSWIRAALEKATSADVRRVRDEMRLRVALASALTLRREAPDEIVANWEQAYKLATVCADTLQRLRALFSLIMNALDAGGFERCEELCATFRKIAEGTPLPAAEVNARRLEGIVKAYRGEFDSAIQLLSPVAEHYPHEAEASRPDAPRLYDDETLREANAMATDFGVSLHIVTEAILAASCWFMCIPQPSARLHRVLCAPQDENEPVASAIALELACALAVLDDDITRAESYATSLVTRARLAGLHRWLRAGLNTQLWLEARRGSPDAALRLLAGVSKRLGRGRICLLDLAIVATLLPHTQFSRDAELTAALSASIHMAVKQGEMCGEHWHIPELQRIDAVLRLATGEEASVARALLEQALERARRNRIKRSELHIIAELEALDTWSATGALRIHPVPFVHSL
ncbi:ATP-binding protein [Trinickia acidisoli]|uniref:ATP-binding protein n=1 Tax=Trinickia acidisoli TaxID=2767482 RepID=UPI001A8C8989|nr:winged helix-turn-helix domain-containing protein [Trinickia acidisoli]